LTLSPDVECCNREQAAEWLEAVVELALLGDEDAIRWLPKAIDHYLEAVRRESRIG
jgi:hypothetical protein